jgi:hypothetical protein
MWAIMLVKSLEQPLDTRFRWKWIVEKDVWYEMRWSDGPVWFDYVIQRRDSKLYTDNSVHKPHTYREANNRHIRQGSSKRMMDSCSTTTWHKIGGIFNFANPFQIPYIYPRHESRLLRVNNNAPSEIPSDQIRKYHKISFLPRRRDSFILAAVLSFQDVFHREEIRLD